MSDLASSPAPTEIKSCCAQFYASDYARLLIGETLHPGGLALTSRLAEMLQVGSESLILDVACGRGASAVHLARTIGCRVIGVDYSAENVEAARTAARTAGVHMLCTFIEGDAESLPVEVQGVDAIICECALCTFPSKAAAAREFARVSKPGTRIGIADVTRNGVDDPDLDGLLAWIACIADAQAVDGYVTLLTDAGLQVDQVVDQSEALSALIERIAARLTVAKVSRIAEQIGAAWDFQSAQRLASAAQRAVDAGRLGYSLITARRP